MRGIARVVSDAILNHVVHGSKRSLSPISLSRIGVVYVIERVRSSQGDPFCHLVTYVPIEIGRTFSPAALESGMLIDLIQATGRSIGTAEQTVSATIADEVLAGHLDIHRGAPILHVARTVFDTNNVPVEYFEASFRPDKFRLSMLLERGGTDENTDQTAAGGIG